MPASLASSPPQVGSGAERGLAGCWLLPCPRLTPGPCPCLGTRLWSSSLLGSGGWGGWGGPWFPVQAVCLAHSARSAWASCLSWFTVPPHSTLSPLPAPRSREEGTGRDWAANFGGTSLPGHDWHWLKELREVTSGLSRQCHCPCNLRKVPWKHPAQRPSLQRQARSFHVPFGLGLPDVMLGRRGLCWKLPGRNG